MTSKQRAYLISLAMKETPVVNIGKSGLTPEVTTSCSEALAARELIKVNVQQNCMEPIREMAVTLSERSNSEVVQVIGRKIVLYREGKDDKKKIVLPPAKKK